MPVKTDREYRDINTLTFNNNNDNNPTAPQTIVEGLATTYNNPYKLYEDATMEIWEEIDRRAFENCDMSDTILQYDHAGRVLARTSNNTLIIDASNPDGLFVKADLSGTEAGRQMAEEIRGQYITKMSMGFKVGADEWTTEQRGNKTIEKRTITEITKLYDVSAVSIPANPATEISIRALTTGAVEKVAAERTAQYKKDILRKIIISKI